jgi:hypothetical protein
MLDELMNLVSQDGPKTPSGPQGTTPPVNPQEAPKLPSGPQGTIPPAVPQPPPVPELTPVQQSIVQAPSSGEAMGGALKGAATGLIDKAVDTKLSQIGSTVFEFGKGANEYGKEAYRQTAAGILAGIEGTGRAAANMLPDRWFEVFGISDDNGNPVTSFSTDPKDFVYAPNGAWGEFLSDITTQAIMSYAIAQTGGAALGALGPKAAGLKKAFDFSNNQTRFGQLAAFMNVNGVENLVQRMWETRAEGVQDVRWWAKTLGIEKLLPEVLASGKDLSTLEQAASDYLGGATGGSLASGTLMGIAKMGLSIIGKGIDSAFDHFGGPPRGTPERERLALAYAGKDTDTPLREGIEAALNDPLAMKGTPPPKEVTGADIIEGKAPPAPETVPIFRINDTIDEAQADAARQRIAELLPSDRKAVEEIETLQARSKKQGTIVETKEGAPLSVEALDLPIAQRKQKLLGSITERIEAINDPKSSFDPATRQLLYKDVVTAFAYDWTRLLEEALPRIVEDGFTKKNLANDLMARLAEYGFAKDVSRMGAADELLFTAIANHALVKTFKKLFDSVDATKQQTILGWIAEARAARFAAERNPTAALSNMINVGLAKTGTPKIAETASEELAELTMARASTLQVVRTLFAVAPDGDISRLTPDQRGELARSLFQSFYVSLVVRNQLRKGALVKDGSYDVLVNEALLRRSQATPPTKRDLIAGSKEAPSRSVKQLTQTYEPPPPPPVGTPEFDEYQRTIARSAEQRRSMEEAALGGGQEIPTEMPTAAVAETEFTVREVEDIQPDKIIMSGDVSVPTATGGTAPRAGGYNVGSTAEASGTLLSELASQRAQLADDILSLIRAGVLDAGETRAVLNQIRNSKTTLDPDTVEFMQKMFNHEQELRLETLALMTEIFHTRNKTSNPLHPNFLSDMPPVSEIREAAVRNAQARINRGDFRIPEKDRITASPEEVLRLEAEYDITSIQRELMNISQGYIGGTNIMSDVGMPDINPAWERRLNRILTAFSKAHLTYSAKNVLAANTIQYWAEAVAAKLHASVRSKDMSPANLAALYRTKSMIKNILVHNVKSIGAASKASMDVGKTGRSAVFAHENRAKEMLARTQAARSELASGGSPTIFDNSNALLEGVGVTMPARTVGMADELFRLRIYETEFKTQQVYLFLRTNGSTDLDAAARYADDAFNKLAEGFITKNEATMFQAAAKKIDALNIFRDANGKVINPIAYAAAVKRQYWEDLSVMRMTDPSKSAADTATEGFDIVNAPDVLVKTNDDLGQYIAHQASATSPEGVPGAIAGLITGQDLTAPLRALFSMINIFPSTRINETYKIIDYMSAAPRSATQLADQKIFGETRKAMESRFKKAQKSPFYTQKELHSRNPVARKRAEARLMLSGLLYAAFGVWYFNQKREEPDNLTVESATGTTLTPPEPDTRPSISKATVPFLQERGSPTVQRARRVMEQKRGEVAGLEVPLVTPALNIFDLLTAVGENAVQGLRRPDDEAAKRIIETMTEGVLTGANTPEDMLPILSDVADVLGASDVVDSFKNTAQAPGSAIGEMIAKLFTIPAGGFNIWGTLAELQSGYKLESRVTTPFGSGGFPNPWWGAGDTMTNIVRFMGRKGREQRESVTGAKKMPPTGAGRYLPTALAKVFGLSTDYVLDIGDGTTVKSSQSLAKVLAQQGYLLPIIERTISDPDPTQIKTGSKVDLTKFFMGDNRDAHSHLMDIFISGAEQEEIGGFKIDRVGGLGGKGKMNLYDYLDRRLTPIESIKSSDGKIIIPKIGSAEGRDIPDRVLNMKEYPKGGPELSAEDLNKILLQALNERMQRAVAILVERSEVDKQNKKIDMGLKSDFKRLAEGGIK